MNPPNSQVLQIGAWRVDPSLDEISTEGTTVKLEPRTMRLLGCLAEHAGQVVSVEQIGIEPALDPLRSDDRFRGLLSRAGLTR